MYKHFIATLFNVVLSLLVVSVSSVFVFRYTVLFDIRVFLLLLFFALRPNCKPIYSFFSFIE